jgi:glycosyltransferase involved in cell wall biosynthesis
MRPISVVLDARLITGEWGGVESVVIGLASGLSTLEDGVESYRFLTYAGKDDWLRPYLSGPCSALTVPAPPAWSDDRPVWRRIASRYVPSSVKSSARRLTGPKVSPPPASDGTIERLGADLMHFTFQNGFLTAVPSIYHPHDLQHLHLPDFFDPREYRRRELWYRTLCEQAAMVAVASTATRQDVMQHYDLPSEKVQVVPLAPVIGEYGEPDAAELREMADRLGLPSAFILYPAQTWPHKNHLGLVEALASLRDQHDLVVPLVCTGAMNQHYPTIERRVLELDLADQVRFLGFVTPLQLRTLYGLARAVVVPSLFEAASAPLWEAFLARVPAACSNVTSLPEQAGDAALVFDPRRTAEIADAVVRIWRDDDLRARLVERGTARVSAFTWERTARHFRAHYRRLTDRPLDDSDRAILSAPPLL